MALQTPDALPGRRRELEVNARPAGSFAFPTVADVPDAPKTTGLEQLGNALARFSGTTGLQAVEYTEKVFRERDEAEGTVAGTMLAQQKNIKDLNQAVKEGQLPRGVAPQFMQAANIAFLRAHAEQDQMDLKNEYARSGVKGDDSADAYSKFFFGFQESRAKALLYNEDGSHKYTPMEIAKSQYHERLADGGRAVENEHIAHRTKEREKIGYQNGATLLGTLLKNDMGTNADGTFKRTEDRDHKAIAQRMTEAMFGPGSIGAQGGDKAVIGEMIQDALLSKALEERDITVLDIGRHLQGPAGLVSDNTRFKLKSHEARLNIAGEVDTERRNLEHWMRIEATGKTIEERRVILEEQHRVAQNEFTKKNLFSNQVDIAMHVKDWLNITPEEAAARRPAMERMFELDPEKAATYFAHFQQLTKQAKADRIENTDPKFLIDLTNAVGKNKGDAKTMLAVDHAMQHYHISQQEWTALRTAGKQFRDDSETFKDLFADTTFTRVENEVRHSIKTKANEDLFGETATFALRATLEFRQHVANIARENPKLNTLQIMKLSQEGAIAIGAKYNADLLKAIKDAEADHKNKKAYQEWEMWKETPAAKAQVKAATDQTALVKKMDAAGIPVNQETLAAEAAKGKINPKNRDVATKELGLNAQELNVYNHHLRNLHGTGRVDNKNGSVSTVRNITVEFNGRHFNLPTIWDGKELSADEAVARAKKVGLDKFPSYATQNEADRRYEKIHKFFDRDVEEFQKK